MNSHKYFKLFSKISMTLFIHLINFYFLETATATAATEGAAATRETAAAAGAT